MVVHRKELMVQAPINPVARAPGVLASAATGMVGFINQMGGDVERIFGNARIAPDMAGSPTLKLRLSAFCRLFEEAARQTRHGNFGLWFGNQFQPRDLGFWGYAAISSPTLGSALENFVELFTYHQECSRMTLKSGTEGLIRLEYQIEAPTIVERRQDAELSLGMFLNLIRECCGQRWAPEEVHFEHPKPAQAKEHEAAFNAPVYFSQATNALLFKPEILARQMPSHDSRLMNMMRMCLIELGSRTAADSGVLDRVRTAVRARLSQGSVALEAIADEVQLPVAVLHREFSQNSMTFKSLVEDVRRDLAISYMKQRQLPLSEVALLLGYSELSAFSRAFRRWTGRSPRTFRSAISTSNQA
jgi:AraC-like DNA-binding protein